MKKSLLLLTSLIVLASCNQVPYPEGGDLVVEGRDEQIPIPQPHALVVDDVIEYIEGRMRNYIIQASVDEPGEALVIAENLPEGAVFNVKIDEETGRKNFELKWRPDMLAANDVNNPTVKRKDYPVVFEVSSSLDPERDKRRFEVILRVNDNPQGVVVKPKSKIEVTEGMTLKSPIKISDRDFPQGPFNVEIDGVPEDVQLEKADENTYNIVYTPSHFVVSLPREKKDKKTFDGVVTVTNPRGGRTSVNTPITVHDKRLYPVIIPPENVTQGLDVSLQVVSHDLNKEIAPVISLGEINPSFGDFSVELVKDPKTFSSVLNVKWTNIPPKFNGTEQVLNFKTCVNRTIDDVDLCSKGSSKVKIVLRDRLPPKIYRASWRVGELVYLGHQEVMQRDIEVVDREDRRLKPVVKIFPVSMRKYVQWEKNKLTVRFDKPGTFQFNIVATSPYNVSSAESFIVEVFPKNRKKVLFFADSTRDPEAIFYKHEFDAQMMNPAIQTVSKRNISDRETLIVTTSTLLDIENRSTIMRAIDAIPNVVVASPLIENLPEKFLNMLRKDYDLDIIGRYSQISNVPLDKMFFDKTKEFAKSKYPIGLKGKASIESRDPAIFNGGLYDREKICKGVLGITPDGNNPLVIGASCIRQGKKKGRFVLLGTEWADLKTTREDLKIPSRWFKTMLKGEF